MDFEHLDWDSHFFGFPVGKIYADGFDEASLASLLESKYAENYQLTYVFFRQKPVLSEAFLRRYGGCLVDQKITYSLDLDNRNPEVKFDLDNPPIKILQPKAFHFEKLFPLALLSGAYSRYRTDKRLPFGTFERMYEIWLKESVNRRFANEVWIWEEIGEVLGFVTLRYTANKGSIGLIAVSPQAQGKKIGRQLVETAISFLSKSKIPQLEVATQIENQASCHFYEASGFRIERSEYIYHFIPT